MLMKNIFCCGILLIVFNICAQDGKYQIGCFYSSGYSCRLLQDDFNFGFSTGAEISKELRKKMKIVVGLYYSKANFYEEKYNKYLYSEDIMGYGYKYLNTKVSRQTEFIETPVLWNQIVINKPKFNFYFTIGLYPSFFIKSNNQASFQYNGEVKNAEFYYLNTGDSSFFENKINTYHKTNVLLTSLFGFSFDYRISERFNICIRPEIRSKINFRYEETIKSIGVNFGMKYTM